MHTSSAKIIALVSIAILAAGAARAQNIAAGKGIAQVWCSNCHGVDPQDQKAVRGEVPTLLEIARMKSTTETSLAAFLTTPHGGMPNLTLSRKEISDLSAYILSLRK